jgi:putative sterol carrier protein
MSDVPEFGTIGFYDEVARQLNADPQWREMATPITYTMTFHYLEPTNKYFYLKFESGEITETAELSGPDERHVDFLIEGKPESWAGVIKQEINPNAAMATGKLKVQGKQTILLRHMKKFSYMINKMTTIEAVFPS